jgi:prolyl oligopeptidase
MRFQLTMTKTLSLLFTVSLLSSFFNCTDISTPPVAEVRMVTDTLHREIVSDPYRWLEDWNDPDVQSWSEQQNLYARDYLENLPGRNKIRERLTQIYNSAFPSYYSLSWRGGKLFAKKYQPPLNQPLLVVMTDPDNPDTEQVVLDLNSFDPSHRTSMDWYQPSPDGQKVAVSLSKGGSEEGDLYLFDTSSGEPQDIVIARVNRGTAGGDLAWLADGSGFYYTRYPSPGERPDEDLNFYQQVWFHQLNTPVEKDRYIIGKDFEKICEIRLDIKYPENDLLLTVQYGDGGTFAFYLVKQNGKWHQIADYADQIVEIRFGPKNSLLLLSNKNAPRGKILQLPINATNHRKAKLLIPEGENSIISVFGNQSKIVPTDNYLLVAYQTGGPSEIRVFNLKGKPQKGPDIPPLSTIHEMIKLDGEELLISNSSYIHPKGWYRYNPETGNMVKIAISSNSAVDYSDTEVLREYAISKDGTRIPVNIIKLKSVTSDGKNPTLLYGYGGYGLSRKPSFSSTRRVWIEQGGIYAIANIRGGGEFGEEWHQDGMLTKKQNVFDDFAAAMKYLIDAGYTSREKLAIRGGSNGGLLMGAMITQHPDLFRTTVSTVGIYDMIRVELSPNGTFNIPEFGTVKNPDHFKAMYAYSPYHRVMDGTVYPAVLFMTGANDPRVDPMQSRKMTARLQAASAGDAPVLLRTSSRTGHGGGTPLSDKIEESVDQYSFLFYQLGVEYQEVNE